LKKEYEALLVNGLWLTLLAVSQSLLKVLLEPKENFYGFLGPKILFRRILRFSVKLLLL